MDESDGGARISFEVPDETTAAADPGEGVFVDPALGHGRKAGSIKPLHNFQFPYPRVRDNVSHSIAPVAAVGEDVLDEGEQPSCPGATVRRHHNDIRYRRDARTRSAVTPINRSLVEGSRNFSPKLSFSEIEQM